MLTPTARRAKRLRSCPACGSTAVRTTRADKVGEDAISLRLQCGACGTWRDETFVSDHAHAVASRLKRFQRRDRQALEDDLRRLRLGGVACDDHGGVDSYPSPFY